MDWNRISTKMNVEDELFAILAARKNLILKQKWEERNKNINFFLVFNFFNSLLSLLVCAKGSLFIAFILEQIFVYDI